jgi:S-adenosylmethionine hydrolase
MAVLRYSLMNKHLLCVLFFLVGWVQLNAQNQILVLQSDFGSKDGAVAAMKGVAMGLSSDLKIFDLTHEIPPFDIWEAAYRLEQTAEYWPAGTVFVSVVDPGVGSERKSVVLKTRSGHFFVTPDNGTLTLIAETLGIEQVREIDEARNRRANSEKSYTFHGRDVYAYTGAALASGKISLEEVGPELPGRVVALPFERPHMEEGMIRGNIVILDPQYGNVWSNIPQSLMDKLNLAYGDLLHIRIFYTDQPVFEGLVPYSKTFEDVEVGQNLAYINSLLNFSLAINQGNFSAAYKIKSGEGWKIQLKPAK